METMPMDNLEKEMRSLVAEILEIGEEKIRPDAKFVEEFGMDSMMALEILASTEKKYKIKIPEDNLVKIVSLNNLVEVTRNILGNK